MLAHRQALVVVAMLMAVGGTWWMAACRLRAPGIDVGFWFEPVTFESEWLSGAVTSSDLVVIEATARVEIADAFRAYPLTLSDRRDARYRVAVVQQILDRRLGRAGHAAGESRAITGLGGSGAVSFSFLASGAGVCAPAGTARQLIVEAIGRGIGRTAVHEIAHQLFPSAPIHGSSDAQSYEYRFAGRCQQFFGPMRWSVAEPLLRARFGGPRP